MWHLNACHKTAAEHSPLQFSTVSSRVCPRRAPAAAVPVGRCGAQPPPLGAAQLPPVCPQPGNLGAGTGRPGGKQRGGGRAARLSPGQNACWDCRWLKIVNSRA